MAAPAPKHGPSSMAMRRFLLRAANAPHPSGALRSTQSYVPLASYDTQVVDRPTLLLHTNCTPSAHQRPPPPLAFMCILHVTLRALLSLMKCVRQRQRGSDHAEARRAARCLCEEGSEMPQEGGEQRSEGSSRGWACGHGGERADKKQEESGGADQGASRAGTACPAPPDPGARQHGALFRAAALRRNPLRRPSRC